MGGDRSKVPSTAPIKTATCGPMPVKICPQRVKPKFRWPKDKVTGENTLGKNAGEHRWTAPPPPRTVCPSRAPHRGGEQRLPSIGPASGPHPGVVGEGGGARRDAQPAAEGVRGVRQVQPLPPRLRPRAAHLPRRRVRPEDLARAPCESGIKQALIRFECRVRPEHLRGGAGPPSSARTGRSRLR